jgi:hypothetical protein
LTEIILAAEIVSEYATVTAATHFLHSRNR